MPFLGDMDSFPEGYPSPVDTDKNHSKSRSESSGSPRGACEPAREGLTTWLNQGQRLQGQHMRHTTKNSQTTIKSSYKRLKHLAIHHFEMHIAVMTHIGSVWGCDSHCRFGGGIWVASFAENLGSQKQTSLVCNQIAIKLTSSHLMYHQEIFLKILFLEGSHFMWWVHVSGKAGCSLTKPLINRWKWTSNITPWPLDTNCKWVADPARELTPQAPVEARGPGTSARQIGSGIYWRMTFFSVFSVLTCDSIKQCLNIERFFRTIYNI